MRAKIDVATYRNSHFRAALDGLSKIFLRIVSWVAWLITLAACAITSLGLVSQPSRADGVFKTSSMVAGAVEARDDRSPWGIALGAERFSDYPKLNPRLREAGVRWLRGFYEWNSVQPKKGEWNWRLTDRLVANTKANQIQFTGVFAYLAAWASADGGTRSFPIKDMQYWRDYISGMVSRYHHDIKYWEVWNEFNGSFAENGSPQIYADLVREAYDTAKRIDPTVKIGMSVANFDVGFLNAAIKAGAADHFDYICVHPYENLAAVAEGGERDFLSMAGTLRQMLAANKQRSDLPLWITEIGAPAPVRPDDGADRLQAGTLAKAYLLSIASGFQRVFWFEARGPSYGSNGDFGVIRNDWTPRPSFLALKTLIGALGDHPQYLGRLALSDDGHGFLYRGRAGEVLAVWSSPSKERKISFNTDVHIVDLAGRESELRAGQELVLTGTPFLIVDVPPILSQRARNTDESSPQQHGGERTLVASCRLGAVNIDNGIRQINLHTTVSVYATDATWRRTDFTQSNNEGHYVYFRVDSQFATFGTTSLEITAVVQRVAPDKVAGMNLDYESLDGYVGALAYKDIPKDDGWHELIWRVSNANFVGGWAWNFRLNAISSPNEFYIKEVRVRKAASAVP